MLLRAVHAAKAGSKAVTAVMVLCLGFHRDIPCSIYQKCETKNHRRFIDFRKLASSLGDSICDALIGLHAFTGCGKLGAWKPMKRNSTYKETFSQLGQSWEVFKRLFDKIQLFTCHLYATMNQLSLHFKLSLHNTGGSTVYSR